MCVSVCVCVCNMHALVCSVFMYMSFWCMYVCRDANNVCVMLVVVSATTSSYD